MLFQLICDKKDINKLFIEFSIMIDKALIGAIERALERNESYRDILESMINCGYQEQDFLEAYNLVMHHYQEVQKRPKMIQTKNESGLFMIGSLTSTLNVNCFDSSTFPTISVRVNQ